MGGIANDITGIGEAVTGVSTIAKTVEDTIFRLFPSMDKGQAQQLAQALEMRLLDQQAALDASQSAVNQIEAANTNMWVAGWRPGFGWMCVAAAGWNFFLQPMLTYFFTVAGHPVPPLPTLDGSYLESLTFGLLGLGGLRTLDKHNQAQAASSIKKAVEVRRALPVLTR